MPLMKRQAVETAKDSFVGAEESHIPQTGMQGHGPYLPKPAPMTKDDYWRRREERDIETGIRIRRSGVIQAAAMSIGTSQYNTGTTIDSYADVVEKLAERMLAWVNK